MSQAFLARQDVRLVDSRACVLTTVLLLRHDFVVVETIEFEDDEDEELPMLLTQRDVVLMNKAGPLEEEDQLPAAALANGNAKEVEMSEEEKAMVAEADAAAAPVTTAADRAADGAGAAGVQTAPTPAADGQAAATPASAQVMPQPFTR